MKMYPSCSVWIGRFPGSKPEYEEEEWTDDKGKVQKSRYRVDEDVNIATDCFPNGGLLSAYNCIKEGHDMESIEWDNNGGGASSNVLETDFQVAQWMIDLNLDMTNEEIEELDSVLWEDNESKLADKLTAKSKMNEKDWFKLAETCCNKHPKLANMLLKVGKVTNPIYIKTIKDQITLNAIAGAPE